MHSESGTLETVAPFDYGKSLAFLGRFRPLGGEQEIGDGRLTKGVIVDGSMAVYRLSAVKGGKDSLSYEVFSEEKLGEKAVKEFEEGVSFFLSLRDDLGEFYSIAKKDASFYPKVKELWGLHHVKFPSLIEISCWAILAQRVQMPVAKRMKEKIVERFGGKMDFDGKTYRAFPDYGRLKGARPSELLEATRNQRSAVRLGSLIENFGDLDESFLRTALYEKAEERLRRVNGIGEWSAQFILYRGLGRIEKLRYGMKPVEAMMASIYGPDKKLEEINAQYGPWCGYWSLYLWGSSMAARTDE